MRLLRPENALAHLGELAHPGDEAEPDVRIGLLDDRVEPAKVVAVGARDLRFVQRVQDRLVVLVDQHRDRPSGLFVEYFQEMPESFGSRGVLRRHIFPSFNRIQLRHQVRVEIARLLEMARCRSSNAGRDSAPTSPSGRG